MAEVRIGIAGSSYDGWGGLFYPEGLSPKRHLEYASRQFNGIEINGSFYSVQTPLTHRRWYETTPRGFVFAVKGSRFITHNRKLGCLGSSACRMRRGRASARVQLRPSTR